MMGAMAADGAPSVGDTFATYKIESSLGEGGMGYVFRAVGPDGKPVALKVVKPEMARDEIFRRRFDREARIAQKVIHPHVVPVLDSGEQDGIPFMAQELIRGGSLEERLKTQGPLDVETAVSVCTAVSTGLDALHQAGLIHRDVKPGNILLDEQGTAYIADFGLAKDREGSVLTKAGQTLGSMDYMAPEQIRGEEVTAATDVYALGCVMYECMCGQPPFADRQGMRILWAHLQEDPPDLLKKRSDLPADVGWAIVRALEKEPDKRPPTATAYAQMVRIAAGAGPGGR
jgi:serine/threonine protein kinase